MHKNKINNTGLKIRLKEKKLRYRAVKAAGILVSVTLLFTSLFSGPSVKASSIEELKAEQAEIEKELDEAKSGLSELTAQGENLKVQLDGLKNDQKVKEEEYQKVLDELENAKKNLENSIGKYEKAVKDVQIQQEAYEKRVSSLFKIRHKSTLELMLESESMNGFFTNMRLMDYIGNVDQKLLEKLDTAKQVAAQAKKDADKVKSDYEKYAKEKEKQIEEIKQGIASSLSKQEDINASIESASEDISALESRQLTTSSEIESLQAEAAARAEAYAEEQRRREAERASEAAASEAEEAGDDNNSGETGGDTGGGNSGGTTGGSGRMIMPLTSYYYVSSDFGFRSYPIYGTHWGVDFAADPGTPVRAAHDGVVVVAHAPIQGSVYGNPDDIGYGNYAAVMRADGVITIYAHLQWVDCYVGQQVSAGEYIGRVGSTGWSTGPHLHFQVKDPASSDPGSNPWNYL